MYIYIYICFLFVLFASIYSPDDGCRSFHGACPHVHLALVGLRRSRCRQSLLVRECGTAPSLSVRETFFKASKTPWGHRSILYIYIYPIYGRES